MEGPLQKHTPAPVHCRHLDLQRPLLKQLSSAFPDTRSLRAKFNTMSLSRCVAFVTGGSSGLGRSTAARIVRSGGRVVIADLPSSSGEEVAADISGQDGVDASSGPRCVFAPVDVTSEGDVTSGLDLVNEAFGEPLNAVVNCAGIGREFVGDDTEWLGLGLGLGLGVAVRAKAGARAGACVPLPCNRSLLAPTSRVQTVALTHAPRSTLSSPQDAEQAGGAPSQGLSQDPRGQRRRHVQRHPPRLGAHGQPQPGDGRSRQRGLCARAQGRLLSVGWWLWSLWRSGAALLLLKSSFPSPLLSTHDDRALSTKIPTLASHTAA